MQTGCKEHLVRRKGNVRAFLILKIAIEFGWNSKQLKILLYAMEKYCVFAEMMLGWHKA